MLFENVKGNKNALRFYNPKTVSWFSTLANIFAWLNLITAILYLIFEIFTLDQQVMLANSQNLFFMKATGHWWEWQNLTTSEVLRSLSSILITFISTASGFVLFKSVSIGLNVLLEIGFTMTPNDEVDEKESDHE